MVRRAAVAFPCSGYNLPMFIIHPKRKPPSPLRVVLILAILAMLALLVYLIVTVAA